jgi:UDPglucose 6-dehydrogenase
MRENRIMKMSIRAAELTKYAANAMLATRISFMNDLARFADIRGIDIEQVRRGMGSDERIGPSFLYPGIGYGGSCFPKDVKALIHAGREWGHTFGILEAVEEINERQKKYLLERLLAHLGGDSLEGQRFAVWGLSFKPQTDDMREAPSIPIIRGLLERGASVRAFDPVAMENAGKIFGPLEGLEYGEDPYEILEGAHGLLLLTEWPEFRSPDFERMKELLQTPLIFDGRNQYDPGKMRDLGFVYYGIGRGGR